MIELFFMLYLILQKEVVKNMSGEDRRKQILEILKNEDGPLSGTELAKRLNVSRQVVVQDIALLRAVNRSIVATNKGYLFFHE